MQLPGGGLISVANRTALAAVPTGTLAEGQLAFVASQLAYFQMSTQNIAFDGSPELCVQPSDDSNKHWRRLHIGHLVWQTQANWTINSSTGNDENDGSSGSPLASFAEFNQRLGGKFYVSMTVQCVSLSESVLELIATPMRHLDGSGGLTSNPLPTISILGPSPVSFGTVGTATNADPPTNTAPTLSNSNAVKVLYRLTGGPSNGAMVWGADTGGTVSEWTLRTGDRATAPSTGVTYERLDPTGWHTLTSLHIETGVDCTGGFVGISSAMDQSIVTLENFIIQPPNSDIDHFHQTQGVLFLACWLKGLFARLPGIQAVGCIVGSSTFFGVQIEEMGFITMRGCLFYDCQINFFHSGGAYFGDCLFMNIQSVITDNAYVRTLRLGMFNSPNGISATKGAKLQFLDDIGGGVNMTYGSGNGTCVTVALGAHLSYGNYLPKVTGTRELNFDGLTTAIPPLYPGATSISTDIPMTTWIELGNIQGYIVSFYSGTKITR